MKAKDICRKIKTEKIYQIRSILKEILKVFFINPDGSTEIQEGITEQLEG